METRYTCSLTYVIAKLRLLSRRIYIYIRSPQTLPHTWPEPSQAKVLTGGRRLARSASRRPPVC